MNNKLILIIILIISILVFISPITANDTDNNNFSLKSNLTYANTSPMLNVSSEGPFELKELINEIQIHPYYEGYDAQTLLWMQSLGDKKVFKSTDYFVIMDNYDSDKIPSQFVTDVSIYEYFECEIIKNESLGNNKHPMAIILVKNVRFIGEDVHYYDV